MIGAFAQDWTENARIIGARLEQNWSKRSSIKVKPEDHLNSNTH